MLPLNQFTPLLIQRVSTTEIISIIIRIPLIHRQLVILLPLDSLRNIAPDQLNNEDLLLISDLFRVIYDQRETILDNLFFGEDWTRLLCYYLPVVGVDGRGYVVHRDEDVH